MSWPITTYNGVQYYLFEGLVLMPVDASTGAPILMLRPQGGVGVGIPAIEKGDPGWHAEIDSTINFTALTADDPAPDFAFWTELAPGTASSAQLSQLNLGLHVGADGADGAAVITPDDYGTPVAGQTLVVDSGGTDFTLAYQKGAGRHFPAAFAAASSGDTNKTLATVAISSGVYNFDYRVSVEAQTIVSGTGTNVSVDLVARLNNETSGNDIGRCFGLGGTKDRLIIAGGSPANSVDGWDKVTAGSGCTVYLRTEKQSGSDNYTTSTSTTRFVVKVRAA